MIFDIETDGLNPTKIHVLSYTEGGRVKHTFNYEEMREILVNADVLIGHNIILYDIPVIERILNIKVGARLIDTLPLSWYLHHTRITHGLEQYGVEFGVPKPKIVDWDTLTPEEYAHRCDEDVKINRKLWLKLKDKLINLYDSKEEADRLITYLMFKMDTVREQEKSKWKLDISLAEDTLKELREEQGERLEALTKAMPTVPVYSTKSRPTKPFLKDGSYSVTGAKWFALLKKRGLPEDYEGTVEVLTSETPPNPSSTPQVKDWLFSLGWIPTSFKFVRDNDGNERSIPQIRVEGEHGKELCPSVKKLVDKEPAIEDLERLTMVTHRISVFEGFLRDQVGGFLQARVGGLTNTLRFKHRELVNLPGINKEYGDKIRGSLIARDGYILCGSDMASLEATTKRHYMFPYDPEYVEEMSKDSFDEHLDLAKHAGAVSQKDIDLYLKGEAPHIKPIRTKYKPVNYSAIYGVKKKRLSRELGVSQAEAQKLLDAYWERNWAVKKVIEDTEVKYIGTEMWLYNPVSRFWYSLRYEKDIFSTLNQGTGVYCFDTWVKNFREVRPQITAQFHDEVVLEIKEGAEEKCKKLLQEALDKTNKELILNVELGIDIQFGKRYSEIH